MELELFHNFLECDNTVTLSVYIFPFDLVRGVNPWFLTLITGF